MSQIKGLVGFIMAMGFTLASLPLYIQIVGGLGGLILLFWSIRLKIKEGKLKDMEIRKIQEELKRQ